MLKLIYMSGEHISLVLRPKYEGGLTIKNQRDNINTLLNKVREIKKKKTYNFL